MNIHNARHEQTAVRREQYPDNNIPEVAFVGRSNVGKSSLINAMLNRRGLARVAATPGKTREINFYNIDDVLYFVDLPGYGYAKVSKTVKEGWGEIIETYLNTREQLKLVVMLVDIRHSPTNYDRMMHEWLLNKGVSYVIVGTKIDKIPRQKLKERLSDIRKVLMLSEDIRIIPFSSETKQGRDELWEIINET